MFEPLSKQNRIPPASGHQADDPPCWNTSTHPLADYENVEDLVPVNVTLACPTGDGGFLEWQHTCKGNTTAGALKLETHRCSRCYQHFGLTYGNHYPVVRYKRRGASE
jgi:hypothetical protein